MATNCEYFDLTKIPSYKTAMDKIHSVLCFVADAPEQKSEEATQQEATGHFNSHAVSGEEHAFLFGGDSARAPVNLMDDDSYRNANERIVSARQILCDNRVVNTAFAGLTEDEVRKPHLVTKEEYIFLYGEEPSPELAA